MANDPKKAWPVAFPTPMAQLSAIKWATRWVKVAAKVPSAIARRVAVHLVFRVVRAVATRLVLG